MQAGMGCHVPSGHAWVAMQLWLRLRQWVWLLQLLRRADRVVGVACVGGRRGRRGLGKRVPVRGWWLANGDRLRMEAAVSAWHGNSPCLVLHACCTALSAPHPRSPPCQAPSSVVGRRHVP